MGGSELVRGTVRCQSGRYHSLRLASGRDGHLVVSRTQRRVEVSQPGQDGVSGRVLCYPSVSRLREAETGQPKKLIASFWRSGKLILGEAAPEREPGR